MATMFPSEVESFTTNGESAVYHFLRTSLRPDSSFLVWYSPDIADREPDFIVYSPDSGLVVLEVKDWLVSQVVEVDPKSAVLLIGSKQERRKQPLAQAKEYVHTLMSLLSRNALNWINGKPIIPCPITWGAIFPNITRREFEEFGLGKVMDGQRVLCQDEISQFSPLLKDVSGKALRAWLLEKFPPLFPFDLTKEQTNWLRACIFPVIRLDLPRRGGTYQTEQSQAILALDHEQENLARRFDVGKCIIEGPAGSGKSIILAHQAWHLPRTNKKIRRVLLVCFNLSLVGYIRRLLVRKGARFGDDSITVLPFYSLCERILSEPLSHSNEGGDYYELVVRECLERISGEHPLKGNWDAVLVDEGQDFSEDMAKILLHMVAENGILTVALDSNQSLYQNANIWEQLNIPGLKKFCLTKQYRNTSAIAKYASRILPVDHNEITYAGASGTEPTCLQATSWSHLVEQVANAVASLVEKNVSMSEIAILYVKAKVQGIEHLPDALLMALENNGVLARWISQDERSKRTYDITTDSITISTIHSVKGLDFAHVFLLGLEDLSDVSVKNRHLAYVGMTRARESLTICFCQHTGMCKLIDTIRLKGV